MEAISPFVAIRRDLHQIPELGFQEFKTQHYLLRYIQSLPQERLQVRTWKTGIFVKVNGTSPRKTIGYRADMDGLPIRERRACRIGRSMKAACMRAATMSI